MTRLSMRLLAFRCRVLRWCSASYRDHEQVCRERDRHQRAAIDLQIKIDNLEKRVSDLLMDNAELRERTTTATQAQQAAADQLIAERALRKSAEDRADRYHAETMDALKAQTDWLARGLYHRRPVYGVGAPPDDPDSSSGKVEPIRTKPHARAVAKQVSDDTLRKLYADITNSFTNEVQDESPNEAVVRLPVGPEFSSTA